jgi:uncharacterized membrane protein
MFTDRKIIVVLEYIIGFCILIAVVPLFVDPHPDWSDARWWAYLLFIVGASLTLISCASGMKQRIQLSQRISKIEQIIKDLKDKEVQAQTNKEVKEVKEVGHKQTIGEKFIASLN